jgi:putative FmdB family regulatory protein
MPIYEYKCQNCGHHFEELQKITEESLVICPKCSKKALKRLIGAGSGVIFKGSGFYHTDYKKKSTHVSKASGTSAKHDNKSEKKTETKTDNKTQTKDKK